MSGVRVRFPVLALFLLLSGCANGPAPSGTTAAAATTTSVAAASTTSGANSAGMAAMATANLTASSGTSAATSRAGTASATTAAAGSAPLPAVATSSSATAASSAAGARPAGTPTPAAASSPEDAGASAGAGAPLEARPLGGAGLPLSFQNVHSYRDGVGSLWVFGEVANKGAAALPGLAFTVDLLDGAGKRLAGGTVLRTSESVLAPDDTAVWLAAMSDHPASWARVRISYRTQAASGPLARSDDSSLHVGSVTMAAGEPGYSEKVTGSVTNGGGRAAKVEEVIVALYAADGRLEWVAGQGILFPYDAKQILPAGGSAPFLVKVLSYTAKPAQIKVYVRAQTA